MIKPLLLIGQGARGFGSDNLIALVERLNLPVATTWNAMDMIPYDHRLCVGRPGTVSMPLANWAVDNCEHLIVVGARLDNIVTRYSDFAPQASRVTVDIDPIELQRHRGEKILMDASEFFRMCDDEPAKDWITTEGKYIDREYPKGEASVYHLVEALSESLPEGQLIVTGSSGLAIEAFYQTFRNKKGQRVFHTTGLGAMGYGLPAAIGACLGGGRRPTVLFESDGSLLFAIQNLATIAHLNLPITIIVANNGGYASMRSTQKNYFEGRYIATGRGIPNLAKVAESFGISATTMAGEVGLNALHAPFKGPCLIDFQLMPDEQLSPRFGPPPPMLEKSESEPRIVGPIERRLRYAN